VFHDDDLPEFNNKMYFISVNKKATKRLLEKYPNAINLANIIEFNTTYKGMGIDRQVACLNTKDAVIVDAGSAITVDVVSDYNHEGGFILPGINALSKSYTDISDALKFEFNNDIELNKIPQNTNDAINYGLINSIVLPIKNILNNKKIIFTGGDGLLLSQYFKESTYNKNLIFDNIKLLLDKMALR
jgi:type III pantothenate kinase